MLSPTFYDFHKPSMAFFLLAENALSGYKDFINTSDVIFYLY